MWSCYNSGGPTLVQLLCHTPDVRSLPQARLTQFPILLRWSRLVPIHQRLTSYSWCLVYVSLLARITLRPAQCFDSACIIVCPPGSFLPHFSQTLRFPSDFDQSASSCTLIQTEKCVFFYLPSLSLSWTEDEESQVVCLRQFVCAGWYGHLFFAFNALAVTSRYIIFVPVRDATHKFHLFC